MNLLVIIFLSGLAIKMVATFFRWLGDTVSSSFEVMASTPSEELGGLRPLDYVRIRPDRSDAKLRALPVQDMMSESSAEIVSLMGPLGKKSA